MTSRTALQACVAFFAAMLLGRCLFHTAAGQRQVAATVPVSANPDRQTVSAQPAPQAPRKNRGMPTVIDLALKEVDGGVRNENVRMNHVFSKLFLEGTHHDVPF